MVLVGTLLTLVAVGLLTRFRPLYRVFDDQYPTVALPLILPGMVVMPRVLLQIYPLHLLHWQGPLILTVILALILTGAIARADSTARGNFGIIAWVSLAMGLFGYFSLLGWNAFADHSTARVYPVTVLSKKVRSGHTWDLRLGPWGPVKYGDEVSVTRGLYWSIKPGDTVCVGLKHGAFRIAWYEVGHCRDVST